MSKREMGELEQLRAAYKERGKIIRQLQNRIRKMEADG